MKVKSLLFMFGLAACFVSCQNELVQEIEKEEPLKEGNEVIFIGGDNGKVLSRSGKEVVFEGGVATGAGLYHASQRPPVTATANPGYVIDKFHGGPVKGDLYTYNHTENKKTATFDVDMTPGDNQFEVSFKKNMKQVKISAETGGTVTPSGTAEYQAEIPHTITATANPGYVFAGWTADNTDVEFESASSSHTTFTLKDKSPASTITAKFTSRKKYTITIKRAWYYNGELSEGANRYCNIGFYTVSPEDQQEDFYEGEKVTVYAEGENFGEWNGWQYYFIRGFFRKVNEVWYPLYDLGVDSQRSAADYSFIANGNTTIYVAFIPYFRPDF